MDYAADRHRYADRRGLDVIESVQPTRSRSIWTATANWRSSSPGMTAPARFLAGQDRARQLALRRLHGRRLSFATDPGRRPGQRWPRRGHLWLVGAEGSSRHRQAAHPGRSGTRSRSRSPAGLRSPDWNGALAAPTLANIDADGDLEVVLNTAHSGFVAYDLPGTGNARVLWSTGRGNYAKRIRGGATRHSGTLDQVRQRYEPAPGGQQPIRSS